jgi:hypothetical protein
VPGTGTRLRRASHRPASERKLRPRAGALSARLSEAAD